MATAAKAKKADSVSSSSSVVASGRGRHKRFFFSDGGRREGGGRGRGKRRVVESFAKLGARNGKLFLALPPFSEVTLLTILSVLALKKESFLLWSFRPFALSPLPPFLRREHCFPALAGNEINCTFYLPLVREGKREKVPNGRAPFYISPSSPPLAISSNFFFPLVGTLAACWRRRRRKRPKSNFSPFAIINSPGKRGGEEREGGGETQDEKWKKQRRRRRPLGSEGIPRELLCTVRSQQRGGKADEEST